MDINVEELNDFDWSNRLWRLHEEIKEVSPEKTISYIKSEQEIADLLDATQQLSSFLESLTLRSELGTEYLARIGNISGQEAAMYGVVDLVKVGSIAALMVKDQDLLFAMPTHNPRIDHISKREYIFLDLLEVKAAIEENSYFLKKLTDAHVEFVIVLDRFLVSGQPFEDLEDCLENLRRHSRQMADNVDMKFAVLNASTILESRTFELFIIIKEKFSGPKMKSHWVRFYAGSNTFFGNDKDRFRQVRNDAYNPWLNTMREWLTKLTSDEMLVESDKMYGDTMLYILCETNFGYGRIDAYAKTLQYAEDIIMNRLNEKGSKDKKLRQKLVDVFNRLKYANLVSELSK